MKLVEGVPLMKPFISKVIIAAGLALALGACASSKPVQEEVITEPPPPPPIIKEEVVKEPPPVVQEYTGPAKGSPEEFRIKVGERIYFDTDRYNVDAYDTETLDRQAAWLKAYPNVTVMVAGNCDERGTREYNLALGARRANAVKEYLVSKGVSASRIETISFGKERPIDGRSNEEAWQVNRNAHTQIVSGAVG